MSDQTPPPEEPPPGTPPPPPPPPPPPSYEAPPPGGSAPPPPTQGGSYSPVEAIQYGWAKFTKSPATLLVPVLLTFIVVAVLYFLMFFVILNAAFSSDTTVNSDGSIDYDAGPGIFTMFALYGLIALVVTFALQVLMAGLVKGSLEVADGRSPAIGELFEGWDKTQVLIAAVLIAIGTAVGTLLCGLPALIFSFLASYTMYFVVDKQMPAMDALKASFSFTTSHLGETLLFFLLAAVVTFVGAIPCGLGLLVAYPVVLVGQAYTFRVLNNEPVTPAA